jgi:hypothetical protein
MSTVGPPKLIRVSSAGPATVDPLEDVRRREAFDRDGLRLGTVADMFVDERERRVRLLELADRHGTSLVPVDVVSGIDDDRVLVDASAQSMPRISASKDAATLENPDVGSVYGHFGLAPYWGADYRPPRFPRFEERLEPAEPPTEEDGLWEWESPVEEHPEPPDEGAERFEEEQTDMLERRRSPLH